MKKSSLEKLLKDRKTLYFVLSIMLVSIFTLTVAYAALSTVLTIQGNARVSAADWDIYLNNPKVTSGSVTTNLPVIKTSSTLEFETTLNMPGDFYEFTVDVVNGGSIDAMIENVVKNPELTPEQAKYLKYEITYQNGEAISSRQTLFKDTSMPIKVRIEYRRDLAASDLPTGQVILDLSLTLEYIQSDGSGSSVPNNGNIPISANGDINEIGTIVTIGDQQFYTIGTEGNNVKLFTEDSIAVSTFSDTRYWLDDIELGNFTYVYNSKSNMYLHVQSYKNQIESFGVAVEDARLISYEELSFLGCDILSGGCGSYNEEINYNEYFSWLAGNVQNYFSGTVDTSGYIIVVYNDEIYGGNEESKFGVRPVIVISKDYFN